MGIGGVGRFERSGRSLIGEIADSLRTEGLIAAGARRPLWIRSSTRWKTAGRAAGHQHARSTSRAPPKWAAIQSSARGLNPSACRRLMLWSAPGGIWARRRAAAPVRLWLSAYCARRGHPSAARRSWLGKSSWSRRASPATPSPPHILEHYSETLEAIRTMGLATGDGQFRPYLAAAARQFSRMAPGPRNS